MRITNIRHFCQLFNKFNSKIYFLNYKNIFLRYPNINNFFLCQSNLNVNNQFKSVHSATTSPEVSQDLSDSSNESYKGSDPANEEKVKLYFITPKDEKIEVEGTVGATVMDTGLDNEIGLEGACGGKLACTTCHVYVEEPYEDIIGPVENQIEEDLLDMADFLKPNSRLSCQIILQKNMDGAIFKLPQGTKNFAVDGFVPKKH